MGKYILKKIKSLEGIATIVGFFVGLYFGSSTGVSYSRTASNGGWTFAIIGAVIGFLLVKAFKNKKK
jgi:lipoprotein signal peptidase